MISIQGKYCFTQKNKVILEGHNLITLLGESFFMNRWINNEFEPVTAIVLGKGTGRPRKTDTKLGKLSITKECTTMVDLTNKRLRLTANFNASEVLNTTEIGVSNGNILISHDIYEKISESVLQNDTISNIHLTYDFNLTTGGIRGNWIPTKANPQIFYIYEPTTVVGVVEANSGNGYAKKDSVEELTGNPGTYYYSANSKNLYIHPANNEIPGDNEIIVQTK